MTQAQQELEHTKLIAAPVDVVYGLVADVTRWPVIFEPTIHVEHLWREPGQERFQLWALVHGETRSWTSHRTLDQSNRRITFRQEHTIPPITSMEGEWVFREGPEAGTTMVHFTHRFSVTGDASALEWTTTAVDRNSRRELAALARVAEFGHPVDELLFSFEDTVDLAGPASEAYAFIERSDAWPKRLPHVRQVTLRENEGVQDMTMEVMTPDGNAHFVHSIRVCLPPRRIAYKQPRPPRLLLGHSGVWDFHNGAEPKVTSRHTVLIDPAAVAEVLGPDATVADARDHVRRTVGGNSQTTLAHAAAHVAATQVQATEAAP